MMLVEKFAEIIALTGWNRHFNDEILLIRGNSIGYILSFLQIQQD